MHEKESYVPVAILNKFKFSFDYIIMCRVGTKMLSVAQRNPIYFFILNLFRNFNFFSSLSAVRFMYDAKQSHHPAAVALLSHSHAVCVQLQNACAQHTHNTLWKLREMRHVSPCIMLTSPPKLCVWAVSGERLALAVHIVAPCIRVVCSLYNNVHGRRHRRKSI